MSIAIHNNKMITFFIFTLFIGANLFSSPYPGLSDDDWQTIIPHLLPADHPAKDALDKIFKGYTPGMNDKETFINLGFTTPSIKGLHIYALFHPTVKGYMIKAYRPAYHAFTPPGNDWQTWLKRIECADIYRREIESNKYGKLLKVPQKWIYALPPNPNATEYTPTNFLLVAEDMNLVDKVTNRKYYNKLTTKNHLRAIFNIVTKHGFSDGCSHNNAVWSKDKKIAFVDTETFNKWPVRSHCMKEYLSPNMRRWWKNYVKSKGQDPSY